MTRHGGRRPRMRSRACRGDRRLPGHGDPAAGGAAFAPAARFAAVGIVDRLEGTRRETAQAGHAARRVHPAGVHSDAFGRARCFASSAPGAPGAGHAHVHARVAGGQSEHCTHRTEVAAVLPSPNGGRDYQSSDHEHRRHERGGDEIAHEEEVRRGDLDVLTEPGQVQLGGSEATNRWSLPHADSLAIEGQRISHTLH